MKVKYHDLKILLNQKNIILVQIKNIKTFI